jgi:23S rRNA (uridine2552-2'-O)-methyltransferase
VARGKGSLPPTSKPTGRRATVRVKTAKGRTTSSQRWLQRQLNDPYVAEAKKRGYRSRAASAAAARRPVPLSGRGVVDLGTAGQLDGSPSSG